MKEGKNVARQYFEQKSFSVLDIILISLMVVSAFVATFIQGGGPIGIPILALCIIAFVVLRNIKVKDAQIELISISLIKDNNIEMSNNTLVAYEVRSDFLKKRKDGKLISPNYYITNIQHEETGNTKFTIYSINLIDSTIKKDFHSIDSDAPVVLTEELIKTKLGTTKTSYLNINNMITIPVEINDYNSSQLIETICNRHAKN